MRRTFTDLTGSRSPHWRVRAIACLCAVLAIGQACAQSPIPSDATQVVVVTADGWDATTGTLRTFERASRHDAWRLVQDAADVSLGRAGTAWGTGLHAPPDDGPRKVEGDGRSPAGVFAIGQAFGYASAAPTALAYQAMGAGDYCIDVPDSPLYNRIVDAEDVGAAAVEGSTEPMRLDVHANGDIRYRQGFVVQHNPANVPRGGSCIFAHLWRRPGEATAGCTAMSEPQMERLLGWLREDAHPVFVLLPLAEYQRRHVDWQLPTLMETAR